MTEQDFNNRAEMLARVAGDIPQGWGGMVQNDNMDGKVNVFRVKTWDELVQCTAEFPQQQRDYIAHRWYLRQCSECDKHLLRRSLGITGGKPQITINGVVFDVNGTTIPKCFRDNPDLIVANPERLMDYFYNNQSTGSRYKTESNRLFIVHYSYVDNPHREMLLRSAWKPKAVFYKAFADSLDKVKFHDVKGGKACVIFLLEKTAGKMTCKVYGINC